MRKSLIQTAWSQKEYYHQARKSVLTGFTKSKYLVKLKNYVKSARRVLDCGCGGASILEAVWHPKGEFFGVDISELGIKLGKKRLKQKKNIKLLVGDLAKLEFEDNFFDLVYSAYLLEHLNNPERAIEEMIRVTKKGGCLVFIAPNYGSPLSFSPSSPTQGETLLSQAIKRFIKSFLYLVMEPKNLDWTKVEPKCLAEGKWQSDWDTVVEPYLQTLIYFLKKRNVEIEIFDSGIKRTKKESGYNSGWRLKMLKSLKYAAQILGENRIPPFIYYGEQLFLEGRKS